MIPAVFIDRDDTLTEDMGYSADVERVRLRLGAADAVARFRKAGYSVVVVTNQSGVARGYFSEEQLAACHKRMQELLLTQGAGVDAVYHCPFLDGPEAVVAAYRRDSNLRKPRPGMLLQAAEELKLDLRASWMVGDAQRDVEAGHAAGCRTILLGSPGAVRVPAADFTAPDLTAAAEIILANGHAPASPAGPPKAAPVAGGGGNPAPESQAAPRVTVQSQLLADLLHEVRQWRRESRANDVHTGHIIGAIAQAFAIGALLWGLYVFFEPNKTEAFVRLMAAAVFQLIALTYLRSRR